MRLDSYLAKTKPEHSRSAWQKLIERKLVRVNDVVITSAKYQVGKEDTIVAEELSTPIQPTQLPILYEDDDVVVMNTPAGMLTHAKGILHDEFSVADFVRPKTRYKTDTNRPGIIHRLDRDTSGVLLAVKHDKAAAMITKQFQNRTVKKIYYALVDGVPKTDEAMIDIPIGRNPKAPSTFRVDPLGKTAQTYYAVERASDRRSLVRLQPKTGRTHQLRVHMAYIQCPILGDRVYGTPDDRLYLHATALELTLPNLRHYVFEAPVPPEFGKKMTEAA